MPTIVNPIRKGLLKKHLMEGKSPRKSMIEAGFSPNTAHTATKRKIVKDCLKEIKEEFDLNNITPEYVIKNLLEDRTLALNKQDYATAKGVDELLGKFLAIWTEKRINENHSDDNTFHKYLGINRLDNIK